MIDKALPRQEFITSVFSNRLSWLAIAIIAVFYFSQYNKLRPWIVKSPITWDQADYYAYLPTFVIYADPDLRIVKENRALYGERFKHFLSEKGKPVFRMTMGVAVMNLPFFLAGHAWALWGGYPADGYSKPYYMLMWLSGIVYSVSGLLILRQLLLRYFKDLVVALTLISLGMATNLHNYATYDALMSHAISFFLMSLFIYLTVHFHERQTILRAALIGLVWALITLIRPTNCLILLFFLLYNVTGYESLLTKLKTGMLKTRYLIAFLTAGLLVFLPQLLYWHTQTGKWLYYSYGEKGTFFFFHPHIIDGLFSYRKGWLLYTPVMILALTGFVVLFQKYRQPFMLAVTIPFFLALYVMFSFWCWWYGGSFGCRPVIEYYSILAIPLAASFEALSFRKSSLGVTLLFVSGCMWLNIKQQSQYMMGLIHWDSMSKDFYWDVLFERPLDVTKLITPDYEQAALTGEEK